MPLTSAAKTVTVGFELGSSSAKAEVKTWMSRNAQTSQRRLSRRHATHSGARNTNGSPVYGLRARVCVGALGRGRYSVSTRPQTKRRMSHCAPLKFSTRWSRVSHVRSARIGFKTRTAANKVRAREHEPDTSQRVRAQKDVTAKTA